MTDVEKGLAINAKEGEVGTDINRLELPPKMKTAIFELVMEAFKEGMDEVDKQSESHNGRLYREAILRVF